MEDKPYFKITWEDGNVAFDCDCNAYDMMTVLYDVCQRYSYFGKVITATAALLADELPVQKEERPKEPQYINDKGVVVEVCGFLIDDEYGHDFHAFTISRAREIARERANSYGHFFAIWGIDNDGKEHWIESHDPGKITTK